MSIFDALFEIIIIFGYLNKISGTSSGSSSILKTDQKHRTQKAAEKANELFCYTCETMDINHGHCMNVTKRDFDLYRKCDEDKRICTVKRVSFLSSGDNSTLGHKTWSLSRSCSDRCQPGCIVIGERLKLRKCVKCCVENLCNDGSSSTASPVQQYVPHMFTIFIPLCTFAITKI